MKTVAAALTVAILLSACSGSDEIAKSPTAAPATPHATLISPPGLTPTGYIAPDGRPLYAECIAAGAPLPPELPTPSSDQSAVPMPQPGRNLNAGKEAPKDLPTVDLRTVAASDSSAWEVIDRACYGYSLRLPPGWEYSQKFNQSGYQQGESATLRPLGGDAKIQISAYFSPIDYLAIALAPSAIGADEYSLSTPRAIRVGNVDGVESYTYTKGEITALVLSRIMRHSPNWYVTVGVYLLPPFDEATARDARALVESLQFSP